MRTVVFIVGPGHCGSTLLDLILGSHTTAFSLGEIRAVPRRLHSGSLSRELCGICSSGRCPIWNDPATEQFLYSYFRSSAGTSYLQKRIAWHLGSARRNLYAHLFEATAASVLIDSSKTVAWVRRQLRPFWHWKRVRPFLIYIHRDARGVIASYLRKYPQSTVAGTTKEWVQRTHELEEYYKGFSPASRIRIPYEMLATEPRETVGRICRKLGITFAPSMLNYWRHDHHLLFGNSRTRSLIRSFREDGRTRDSETGPSTSGEPPKRFKISLDERWRSELDRRQLNAIDEIAGELVRSYAYEPKDRLVR